MPQRYIPPEERAAQVFRELYPKEHPADYPRALYAIIKGLRDAEAGAVVFHDCKMFEKGVEVATQTILAVIEDPSTCIDPATRQPTTSHFDWRNVTQLIVERIHALKIEAPTA